MRRRALPAWPLVAVVGVLLLGLARSAAAQAASNTSTVTVNSTAQFLQAVQAAHRGSSTNLTILLSSLQLGNATWVPGAVNTTAYNLTIAGTTAAADSAQPLLDTSRRADLVQPVGASQQLAVQGLQLINL